MFGMQEDLVPMASQRIENGDFFIADLNIRMDRMTVETGSDAVQKGGTYLLMVTLE